MAGLVFVWGFCQFACIKRNQFTNIKFTRHYTQIYRYSTDETERQKEREREREREKEMATFLQVMSDLSGRRRRKRSLPAAGATGRAVCPSSCPPTDVRDATISPRRPREMKKTRPKCRMERRLRELLEKDARRIPHSMSIPHLGRVIATYSISAPSRET